MANRRTTSTGRRLPVPSPSCGSWAWCASRWSRWCRSPALASSCPARHGPQAHLAAAGASPTGTAAAGWVNAVVRLRHGAADVPAFQAGVARLYGRDDIPVKDLRDDIKRVQRSLDVERTALLLFAGAVVLAAMVLIGQAIVRSVRSGAEVLPVLRAIGFDRPGLTAGLVVPHGPRRRHWRRHGGHHRGRAVGTIPDRARPRPRSRRRRPRQRASPRRRCGVDRGRLGPRLPAGGVVDGETRRSGALAPPGRSS